MISSLAQYEEQVLWESEWPVCALHLSFQTCFGLVLCKPFPLDNGVLLCTSVFSDLVNQIIPSAWQVITWCPMARCSVSTRLSRRSESAFLMENHCFQNMAWLYPKQTPRDVFCTACNGAFRDSTEHPYLPQILRSSWIWLVIKSKCISSLNGSLALTEIDSLTGDSELGSEQHTPMLFLEPKEAQQTLCLFVYSGSVKTSVSYYRRDTLPCPRLLYPWNRTNVVDSQNTVEIFYHTLACLCLSKTSAVLATSHSQDPIHIMSLMNWTSVNFCRISRHSRSLWTVLWQRAREWEEPL